MYPFSEIEFEYIKTGLEALPKETYEAIRIKCEKLRGQAVESEFLYECPFLMNGSCSVYQQRGLICRTFGLITENDTKQLTIPYCAEYGLNYSKVYDKETVELLFTHDEELMIQEFLYGQEIGADVYIDMISHEVVSIFTKKKLKMRAGETDKAVSFKDEKLFALIEKFVVETGYRGQIDIDLFEINGEYFISEVNPRFGGGYPHAYECGCDHMTLIANNLHGIANKKNIGAYDEGIYMMKYNEVMVRK